MDRITGRTTSVPNSAHHLILDKVQGLRSGILTYTNLVLLQIIVETRVKVFMCLSSPSPYLQNKRLGKGMI